MAEGNPVSDRLSGGGGQPTRPAETGIFQKVGDAEDPSAVTAVTMTIEPSKHHHFDVP